MVRMVDMKTATRALILLALLPLFAGAAAAQSKPPKPLTPAQLKQERAIRLGLVGAWVIPADGACNSGAPWQFKSAGRFLAERIKGHWRLDGRKLFLAGFDWDLDDKNRQRVMSVWAATWTIFKMSRTRMTMRRNSDGKSFVFHRCK
jgi:hypothetical protein